MTELNRQAMAGEYEASNENQKQQTETKTPEPETP